MVREEAVGGAVLRDLGGGLVMRRAGREDAEALASFNAEVFRNLDTGEPDQSAAGWVRDLMRGDHPTFRPADFLLVEDTLRGEIVSSLCLISQVWAYEGVEFGVGRPELVGTHTDYRRRGLVRALFEELHRLSEERGELLQAITGIPWYYRQFGYELALELGGGRSGFTQHVPRLSAGQSEPYRLLPAGEEHVPYIAGLYRQATSRYQVVTVFDEALWRYELTGRTDESDMRPVWHVIEGADGKHAGALRHANRAWGPALAVTFYELSPGVPWHEVTPGVLRYLSSAGRRYADGKEAPWSEFRFALGADHPVYHVIPGRLPATRRVNAWYIRVPDLPAFVRRIAPALEARLAASPFAGHGGELRISFYRDGLRLAFESGRLREIARWKPGYTEDGDAFFPDLTFLQLLLGYRTLEDLEYAFADCWVKGDAPRGLLPVLFPRKQSHALGIV